MIDHQAKVLASASAGRLQRAQRAARSRFPLAARRERALFCGTGFPAGLFRARTAHDRLETGPTDFCRGLPAPAGAEVCSPRRKLWVAGSGDRGAPEGRKNVALRYAPPLRPCHEWCSRVTATAACFYRPSGAHRTGGRLSHGWRRGLEPCAPSGAGTPATLNTNVHRTPWSAGRVVAEFQHRRAEGRRRADGVVNGERLEGRHV
jgi:hypothetical protein